MSGTTVRNLVHAATVGVMAASQAVAQTVRGVVQEIDTKAPIADAAVAIHDMTGAVVGFSRTDWDGAFRMRIPTSQFSVRVIRVGFRPSRCGQPGSMRPRRRKWSSG